MPYLMAVLICMHLILLMLPDLNNICTSNLLFVYNLHVVKQIQSSIELLTFLGVIWRNSVLDTFCGMSHTTDSTTAASIGQELLNSLLSCSHINVKKKSS